MTKKTAIRTVTGLAGIFAIAGLMLYALIVPESVAAGATACDRNERTTDGKIECWMGIVRETLRNDGLAEAMRAFREIYDTYPVFANSGCHRHAHRVGDMVYYEHYLGEQDITKIEFPPETTSCGYGFFHGFLEHLIQDNPDAEFITETCAHLDETLTPSMGDIRITCYHGSGHGLALATAATVPQSEWGNPGAFVDEPLRICESLPEANAAEVEECQEGVFNVLVDWMEIGEYGFAYDVDEAFALCAAQPERWQPACYYEMAMKVDRAGGFDPRGVARIAESIGNPEYRDMVFNVGIGGLVQHIASDGTHEGLFEKCGELNEHLVRLCVIAVVEGLFEHGRPRFEYEVAKEFCLSDVVAAHSVGASCWDAFASKLRRFYNADMAREQCASIPEPHRQELCSRYGLL